MRISNTNYLLVMTVVTISPIVTVSSIGLVIEDVVVGPAVSESETEVTRTSVKEAELLLVWTDSVVGSDTVEIVLGRVVW